MSVITMTGYMGAITAGAPFIMDYGQQGVEELVRVSDVQPADDVCCKVRLEGTTFWMPEIEFRRRATPVATPANGEQVERIEAWLAEMLDQHDPMCGAIDRAATASKLAPLIAVRFGSTPTEDARERVKALEEALGLLLPAAIELLEPLERASAAMVGQGMALNEHGEAAFDRARVAIDAARTALGNKETDRHG